MSEPMDFEVFVDRLRGQLAHLWMVRTFVKHAPEKDDIPDLLEIPRLYFDAIRAVETRLQRPEALAKMLRKKIGRVQQATQLLAQLVEDELDHTNFHQAVQSAQSATAELEYLLAVATEHPFASTNPPNTHANADANDHDDDDLDEATEIGTGADESVEN